MSITGAAVHYNTSIRTFTTDSEGRLKTDTGEFVYHTTTDNYAYAKSTVPEEHANKQFWDYNGKWIYSRYDSNTKFDLGQYADDARIVLTSYNDSRDSITWDLVVTSGTPQTLNQYTIKRGVMGTDGKIYKVVGSTVPASDMIGQSFNFPHHKAGEISGVSGVTCYYGKS